MENWDALKYFLINLGLHNAVLVILAAAYSSTDIKYVRILSLASTWMFFGLIALMAIFAGMGLGAFGENVSLLGGYFGNLHKFVLPINDYHEFYLFWWFAWSIMIGQANHQNR